MSHPIQRRALLLTLAAAGAAALNLASSPLRADTAGSATAPAAVTTSPYFDSDAQGRPVYALQAARPQRRGETEVRFISLAPSPYTGRHDSMRAGLGIALSLRRIIRENNLPLKVTFYDGVPALDDAEKAKALVRGAPVLLIGGSTWAQGSAYYVRRFFEITSPVPLWGVTASAWATAGGSHTGGEMVIQDSLRSLMGAGATGFTLAQKAMVFTTDERISTLPPGHFELLDVWYMEAFAKVIAVNAIARGNPEEAGRVAERLGVQHDYYRQLPQTSAELRGRYGELQALLNAAADPQSTAYRRLQRLLSHY